MTVCCFSCDLLVEMTLNAQSAVLIMNYISLCKRGDLTMI